MPINPFHEVPPGLNPDNEAFLAEFGGLEVDGKRDKKDVITEEPEPPANEALRLGATQEQKEAYWNTLIDIAPGFKIPRREYEAVVEIFKRANNDLDDDRKILIENDVGDEKSGKMIRVKDNRVICLFLSETKIQSLDGITFPEGLKTLSFSGTQIKSLDGVKLPEGLKILELSNSQIQSLDGVRLPEKLWTVYLVDTPLSQDSQKMDELKAKYPNIEFIY